LVEWLTNLFIENIYKIKYIYIYILYKMKFGHVVHEGLEITSHLGGAVGNASSTILDAGAAIHDFQHHDYVGGVIETGETIYHGVETYLDGASGDWL
jgi:hypothetical protein